MKNYFLIRWAVHGQGLSVLKLIIEHFLLYYFEDDICFSLVQDKAMLLQFIKTFSSSLYP